MDRKLHDFLNAEENALFLQTVTDVAQEFPDIIGVLGVGSLVHSPEIPDDFFVPRYNTARGLAYEKIRNPGRRRLAIRDESDLDLWICTKDTVASFSAQTDAELGAIALLSELASGTIEWGSVRWHNKKSAVLGRYYKNPELYPESFVASNGGNEPWMARQFKGALEALVIERLPDFVKRVNQYFSKEIPGEFFEIRAFPESLFHLRPDDTVMPNMLEDRMAFPRIANDQWISPEHSSLVLYASDSVTIYPFKVNGRVLGNRIADYLAVDDTVRAGKTYGSLVVKPDAIRKKQLDIIMTKVHGGLASFGGRIVARKSLKSLTDGDVEAMYPLLKGRELQEAKDYLVGGELVILVIESDLPAPELFKRISDIKGPRLIDRTYERLMEGRILHGSLRDLLPIPGEEDSYKAIMSTILAKRADPSVRFSDQEYRYYAQNLVHSPDNEIELQGLFKLAGFSPK